MRPIFQVKSIFLDGNIFQFKKGIFPFYAEEIISCLCSYAFELPLNTDSRNFRKNNCSFSLRYELSTFLRFGSIEGRKVHASPVKKLNENHVKENRTLTFSCLVQ